ncbi:MAG TPA: DUF1003 domain-containing protein [Pyrinomonadaceae bacterium]|nr:DUF1003 domain-containing protein [Pyrinomonadaceae bacterium]
MGDRPVSQDEIIRKNIAALAEMQRRDDERRTLTDRVADRITLFSGSMAFVYLHVVWFGVWIVLNIGLFARFGLGVFDEFPYGLLTMIVSLEAIFLSTFVLISQNRMARASEKRAELELQVNMLAEQKAAKTLEMLDHLTHQLDQVRRFSFERDPEIEALKVSPEPGEVLRVIEEASAKAAEKKLEEKVEEITGEVEAVRDDVAQVGGKVEAVTAELKDVKEEIEVITGEHEGVGTR